MRRAGEGIQGKGHTGAKPWGGTNTGAGTQGPLRQGERDETAEASRGRVHLGPSKESGFYLKNTGPGVTPTTLDFTARALLLRREGRERA